MNDNKTLVVALFLMTLIVGVLAGYIFGGGSNSPINQLQTGPVAQAQSVALPNELLPFLSGWNCPCGNCSDLLIDCPCDMPGGASEVKQFVVDLYNDKVPLEQIREKAIKRYGQSVTGSAL